MPKPRTRRVRRNSKSLSWGTLPEYPDFERFVGQARDEDGDPVIGPPGDVFHMELVGKDLNFAKLALKTLFAAGTPVAFEQFKGDRGKYGLRFLDLVSLHKFILALLTISEMSDEDGSNDERAGDLASSIMGVLGYEWV